MNCGICQTGAVNKKKKKVDDVEAFQIRTNTITLPVMTRVFSFIITRNQNITTHIIQFVGHGREQGRLAFSDPAVCEKVLDILRRRFHQN